MEDPSGLSGLGEARTPSLGQGEGAGSTFAAQQDSVAVERVTLSRASGEGSRSISRASCDLPSDKEQPRGLSRASDIISENQHLDAKVSQEGLTSEKDETNFGLASQKVKSPVDKDYDVSDPEDDFSINSVSSTKKSSQGDDQSTQSMRGSLMTCSTSRTSRASKDRTETSSSSVKGSRSQSRSTSRNSQNSDSSHESRKSSSNDSLSSRSSRTGSTGSRCSERTCSAQSNVSDKPSINESVCDIANKANQTPEKSAVTESSNEPESNKIPDSVIQPTCFKRYNVLDEKEKGGSDDFYDYEDDFEDDDADKQENETQSEAALVNTAVLADGLFSINVAVSDDTVVVKTGCQSPKRKTPTKLNERKPERKANAGCSGLSETPVKSPHFIKQTQKLKAKKTGTNSNVPSHRLVAKPLNRSNMSRSVSRKSQLPWKSSQRTPVRKKLDPIKKALSEGSKPQPYTYPVPQRSKQCPSPWRRNAAAGRQSGTSSPVSHGKMSPIDAVTDIESVGMNQSPHLSGVPSQLRSQAIMQDGRLCIMIKGPARVLPKLKNNIPLTPESHLKPVPLDVKITFIQNDPPYRKKPKLPPIKKSMEWRPIDRNVISNRASGPEFNTKIEASNKIQLTPVKHSVGDRTTPRNKPQHPWPSAATAYRSPQNPALLE